jgi:hypothetical protein
MKTPTLTIFANFRINDEERFIRMKDSFASFCGISAEKWIINVRGIHKLNTIFFLSDHLGDKLSPHILDSGKGWFYDSRQLIREINTDFVMIWIEDHINLRNVQLYTNILEEMVQSGSEYLNYTWWLMGHSRNVYAGICKREHKFIESFVLDKNNAKDLDLLGRTPFIISLPSIFSRDLFLKIMNANDPRLRRWPKETPFDFEKNGKDFHWLPIKMSVSKEELFACIDDDNGIPGYSLQARGLYPMRVRRQISTPNRNNLIINTLLSMIPGSLKYYIKRLSYHI